MHLVSCIVIILVATPAFAQDVQQHRQEIITSLLNGRQEKAIQQRWICINGNEPSRVKEARAGGFDSTPDAADSCVAALQRNAKDGSLTEVYKRFLSETGGSPELSDKLAKAIGAAVLSGDGKVSVGNGKAITATGPMAFDAGFTVAYSEGAAKKSADPQKIKTIAESCLANEKDAGTCFSVGYILGTQAFSAR